jgi:CRP/FNR family cyclic AMP-dependent transcriptional regulator
MSSRWHPAPLLDEDPELGSGVPAEDRDTARRTLVVPTIAVETGVWVPPEELPFVLIVGLIVLAGVTSREVVFAGRRTAELIGIGDIVRPWDERPHRLAQASWRVHCPARIGILDARFARACGRWPTVAEAVASRHARRADALSRRLAVAQLPAITDRLLLLFCELAERWGRVTPAGIRLPVPLTHSTLAALVGARRPSVTTALGALAAEGVVQRVPGGWLLRSDIERLAAEIEDPELRPVGG